MQPRLKKHKRYWFYRIYCLAVIVVYSTFVIWYLHQIHFLDKRELPPWFPYMVPFFVIPAIFMGLTWMASPFKYSIFGRFERTPFPQERPVLTYRDSWGRIGKLPSSIPFFSWHVFESGLGIHFYFVGRFFIPVEHIVRMKRGFFSGYKLWHTIPEVRNPVTMPSSRVFEAVLEITRRNEQRSRPAEDQHS